MRGSYRLEESDKEDAKNIIAAILEYMNNHDDVGYYGISLNLIDTNPAQIIDIFKELGYDYGNDFNGWEGDSW
jgi:hypothetical protein